MTRLAAIFLILILFFAFSASAALADASIEVNTAVDENGTGTDCSLREAITAANTNADFGGCVGSGTYATDTITFNSTVFGTAQTITLTSALPNITSNMTITGPGTNLLTVSGNNLVRPFRMSDAFVFMSGMTVTQGRQVGDNGGNIYVYDGQVTLDNMVVSQGYSSQNGGGAAVQFGDLNVRNSIFSNNTAGSRGGGISVHSGASDLIQITGSTFSGNSAAEGGAVSNLYGIVLSNSTFSGNSATTAGGAIWSSNGGGGIVNVTISGNSGGSGSGVYISGNMTIINTIIANNTGAAVNCFGSPTIGNSLISDGSCGIVNSVAGNIVADPLLSTLADNGGATPTMAIGPDSPARNAGNNYYLSEELARFNYNGDADPDDSLTTDQRGSGFNRVVFGTVDMGAFENSTPSTNFVVDTVSDLKLSGCTALPNDCSLRGVISVANYLAGTDTITFSPAVFSTPQTITLTSALPSISSDLSIIGPGTDLLTISGNDLYRPFTISNISDVIISDLTIADSYYAGSGGSIDNGGKLRVINVAFNDNTATFNGGAIYNMGTATINNTTFNGNTAFVGGGAISTYQGSAIVINSTFVGNGAPTGGAVVVSGGLYMVNSTLKDNSAATGGGIYRYPAASAFINNSILADNSGGNCGNISATPDNMSTDATCTGFTEVTSQQLNLAPLAKNGGATLNFLPLPGSVAIDNGHPGYLSEAAVFVDYNGDGDYNDIITTDQRGFNRPMLDSVDVGAVEVQALFTGLVVDTVSDVENFGCSSAPNDCTLRGAIKLANLLDGTQTITFDSSVFSTAQTITLTSALPEIMTSMNIEGPGANLLTISGADQYRPFTIITSSSAAISDMSVTQGHVTAPANGGNMSIDSSTVTLSRMIFSNGQAVNGGSIYNTLGTLIVRDSTIRDNTATSNGGGIFNGSTGSTLIVSGSTLSDSVSQRGGGIGNTGTLIVSNSTIASNTASIAGGGIWHNAGTATLLNVTVYINTSDGTGGGIESLGNTLTLMNSIIGHNTSLATECNGSAAVVSYTIIKDGSCGITNGVNGNLTGDGMLYGLGNNGGPTQTMAVADNSPALNAGSISSLSEATTGVDFNGDGDTDDTLTTDQRGAGFNRVLLGGVDMGAFENSEAIIFNGLVIDTTSDADLTNCTAEADDCSLRGAINLANSMSGADTIIFSSAVFNTSQTITLTSALPTITTNITINGPGADLLTISGNDLYRPFTITNFVTVTFSGFTIKNGQSAGDGGGIWNQASNLTLLNMALSDNAAANGGGVAGSGTTTIMSSTFSGNSATNQGGAISSAVSSNVVLIVNNSTFYQNSANQGGGIYNAGALYVGGSTLSANSATTGGGIFHSSGTPTLRNTIIAGSTSGGNCSGLSGSLDNISTDASCTGFKRLTSQALKLGTLADNGGPTLTIALLAGSAAVDAGSNLYVTENGAGFDFNNDGDASDRITTDQRGGINKRIFNSKVDVGAYESVPADAAPTLNYSLVDNVTLTWGGVTGADYYIGQISDSTSFSTLFCNGFNTPLLTVATCDLEPGTYYWRVRAVTGSSQGQWSAVMMFVVDTP